MNGVPLNTAFHYYPPKDLICISYRIFKRALKGRLLFTWLSPVMSMMVSFCAVFFPTRCLGWDLELNWVSFWGFSFLLLPEGNRVWGENKGKLWKKIETQSRFSSIMFPFCCPGPLIFFHNFPLLSSRWKGDSKRLCSMEPRLPLGRFRSTLEHGTAGSAGLSRRGSPFLR